MAGHLARLAVATVSGVVLSVAGSGAAFALSPKNDSGISNAQQSTALQLPANAVPSGATWEELAKRQAEIQAIEELRRTQCNKTDLPEPGAEAKQTSPLGTNNDPNALLCGHQQGSFQGTVGGAKGGRFAPGGTYTPTSPLNGRDSARDKACAAKNGAPGIDMPVQVNPIELEPTVIKVDGATTDDDAGEELSDAWAEFWALNEEGGWRTTTTVETNEMTGERRTTTRKEKVDPATGEVLTTITYREMSRSDGSNTRTFTTSTRDSGVTDVRVFTLRDGKWTSFRPLHPRARTQSWTPEERWGGTTGAVDPWLCASYDGSQWGSELDVTNSSTDNVELPCPHVVNPAASSAGEGSLSILPKCTGNNVSSPNPSGGGTGGANDGNIHNPAGRFSGNGVSGPTCGFGPDQLCAG